MHSTCKGRGLNTCTCMYLRNSTDIQLYLHESCFFFLGQVPTFNLVNSCLLLFIPMESFQLGKFMEFCNLRHSTTANRGEQCLSLESFLLDSLCTIWAVSQTFPWNSAESSGSTSFPFAQRFPFLDLRHSPRRAQHGGSAMPSVANITASSGHRWQTEPRSASIFGASACSHVPPIEICPL